MMAHRNQPLRRSCTKRYHSTTAYEARRRPSAVRASSASGAQLPAALLFDCDGVLVETERDGHRPAFNKAFQEMGIDAVWDVDEYGELLKVGGGKERMTAYLNGFNGRRECVRRAATEEAARAFLSGRAL